MVLIKDNHIAAAGSITAAVQRVRAANRAGLPVEVEVKSVDELCEALELAVDRILLDNMDPQQMRQAVALSAGRSAPSAVPPRRPFRPVGRPARTGAASPNGGGQPERGRATLEASGGITLSNIAAVAGTGVDYISVGALTHSVQALDISLDVEEE
jgi:nicotinate-nucleotide pyrophosphorylase (carboxylating)